MFDTQKAVTEMGSGLEKEEQLSLEKKLNPHLQVFEGHPRGCGFRIHSRYSKGEWF